MPKLSDTLPGTWILQSRCDVGANGERRPEPTLGDDPIAILYYDRTGNFAAQFMKRDRSGTLVEGVAGAQNNSRAQGGYDAYFGTFKVDDSKGLVTQVLVGSLSKENVGMTVTRGMLVEGDTLTIKLDTTSVTGEPVTRTLIWKRSS